MYGTGEFAAPTAGFGIDVLALAAGASPDLAPNQNLSPGGHTPPVQQTGAQPVGSPPGQQESAQFAIAFD